MITVALNAPSKFYTTMSYNMGTFMEAVDMDGSCMCHSLAYI
jgi:hypothetical protein